MAIFGSFRQHVTPADPIVNEMALEIFDVVKSDRRRIGTNNPIKYQDEADFMRHLAGIALRAYENNKAITDDDLARKIYIEAVNYHRVENMPLWDNLPAEARLFNLKEAQAALKILRGRPR